LAAERLPAAARRGAPGAASRRGARAGKTLALWIAIGIGLGLALAVLAPALAGYRSFTVLSGSMEPALRVGDVVMDEPVAARDVRPGDIVTFPDPQEGGRLITHRVEAVRVTGATADVTTKGDANNAVEEWSIPAASLVGRVVYRLPMLGYVLVGARSPLGRLALVVLPALGLGLMGVRAIWRPGSAPRPT
jgi:signal peptidase